MANTYLNAVVDNSLDFAVYICFMTKFARECLCVQ